MVLKTVAPKKTSLVIPDTLLRQLKHCAVEERTDVSAILRRLAEAYVAKRRMS